MPFCPNCGNQFQLSVNFCSVCGTALSVQGSAEITLELRYHISLQRVLFMTVLSYGLYLLYWFYITWKQYRDHTEDQAYPVWHALTLLVPIYGLFRTYAHMRTFRDLMRGTDMQSSIRPGWSVLLVFISAVLESISFEIGGGFTEFATLTQDMAILVACLDIISITLIAGLLIHVQSNLNRYWQGFTYIRATPARVGWGEIIFAVIGAFVWLNTLASIFSESWRQGL